MNRAKGTQTSILVGLSGGIDSAVAALLLKEQGRHVVALTLVFSEDAPEGEQESPCSPRAAEKAAAVAEEIGVRHIIVDARETFRREVVEYFVREYERGRTPNPCIRCNAHVRFGLMVDVARRQGLSRLATGHYARLLGPTGLLARGVDRTKDQSYVLAHVSPELLADVDFPLGGLHKTEVRRIAASAGLSCRDAGESQEICFIPHDDYRGFLRLCLGERRGAIVDLNGKELAHHTGTYNFTIGQRRGLRLAGGEPWYVVGIDAVKREVIVGNARDTMTGVVTITDVVHHAPHLGGTLTVQLRSSGEAVPADMPDWETVVLHEPAQGIAPGQTAVVYEEDRVVLAGTIVSAEGWQGPLHHA